MASQAPNDPDNHRLAFAHRLDSLEFMRFSTAC
jgi:hypothetical protein